MLTERCTSLEESRWRSRKQSQNDLFKTVPAVGTQAAATQAAGVGVTVQAELEAMQDTMVMEDLAVLGMELHIGRVGTEEEVEVMVGAMEEATVEDMDMVEAMEVVWGSEATVQVWEVDMGAV